MPTRTLPILAIALLALSSTAEAVPIAQYNPATGGVRFTDLVNVRDLYLVSTESPLILANALGSSPQYFGGDDHRLLWTNTPSALPTMFFGGNVVQPGQAADKLHFEFYGIGNRDISDGRIQVVPEPTAMALAASGILGLALIRRRHA